MQKTKKTHATEQQSERSDGSDESESEHLKKVKPRAWRETSGPEIGTFIGVLLLQGICKLPRTENYWITREDLNPIHSAMSLLRWQQIKRYLKISDPRSERDSKGPDWYAKLEPIYSDFLKASQRYYLPGRDVSIDEQLVVFKGRSRHSMLIPSKRAGKGFKIYSLCHDNYVIMFSSRASKISGLKRLPGFTDSSTMVAQIFRSLSNYGEPDMYLVYTDNFFTNVKLFKHLKKHGLGACGTVKAGSGFPAELLIFRDNSSKKNNWGFLQATTVEGSVLCMIWQDLNTVQLMTTCHSPEEIH